MSYKVLLVDHKKMTLRLILSIVAYLLILPAIILFLPQNIDKTFLLLIEIIGILLIPLSLFLSLRSSYSKENIELDETSIITKKFGQIKFSDILFWKIESFNGMRIQLHLMNGFKLTITQSNQFSKSANKEFLEFYMNFQKLNKATQKQSFP